MGNFFINYDTMKEGTHEEAEERARQQGALFVVEVEGGYMAFDTAADYHTWENQI